MTAKGNYFKFINSRFQEFSQNQLHEISNKFNLLSLSLEDLVDILQEENANEKDIKGEVNTVARTKESFLIFLNELKSNASLKSNSRGNLEECFQLLQKMKAKGLSKREKKIGLSSDSPLEREFKRSSLLILLWNRISLRLISFQDLETEIILSFKDQEKILSEDSEYLEAHNEVFDENFKELYLRECLYLCDEAFDS